MTHASHQRTPVDTQRLERAAHYLAEGHVDRLEEVRSRVECAREAIDRGDLRVADAMLSWAMAYLEARPA